MVGFQLLAMYAVFEGMLGRSVTALGTMCDVPDSRG